MTKQRYDQQMGSTVALFGGELLDNQSLGRRLDPERLKCKFWCGPTVPRVERCRVEGTSRIDRNLSQVANFLHHAQW